MFGVTAGFISDVGKPAAADSGRLGSDGTEFNFRFHRAGGAEEAGAMRSVDSKRLQCAVVISCVCGRSDLWCLPLSNATFPRLWNHSWMGKLCEHRLQFTVRSRPTVTCPAVCVQHVLNYQLIGYMRPKT